MPCKQLKASGGIPDLRMDTTTSEYSSATVSPDWVNVAKRNLTPETMPGWLVALVLASCFLLAGFITGR